MTACIACSFRSGAGGLTHAYMSFSPGCWARYGDVLAREYSKPEYWRWHRSLTDACCGQHSVADDRRGRQSLHIHLAALMLHFEEGAAVQTVVGFLRSAARFKNFAALKMPPENQIIDITETHSAMNAEQHGRAVQAFGRGVFDTWAAHHGVFRALIDRVVA